MSKGNLNTYGNKKNNFPYQQNVLLLLDNLIKSSASAGLAQESTLSALLTELQLKADLSETQPVSAASLPLPAGASTEAKQNDALGGNGTEFIFGVGAITGKSYKYLVANEDCTFTTLTGSVTANLLAALPTGLGITTNKVSKGMIIRGKNGELITAVTLATGSVIGVN